MNIRTRAGKVLAEVIEKEEKVLSSGIVLVGEAINQVMEDVRRAKVISSDVDDVVPGDIVVYLRFSGTPLGGKSHYIVLDDKDIFGVER